MADSGGGLPERAKIAGLPRNLALRILSTLVILPPVIALLVLGGWYFAALVALLAGCMAWEWSRIVEGSDDRRVAQLAAGAAVAVVAISGLLEPMFLLGLLVGGTVIVLAAAIVTRNPRPVWMMGGFPVAIVPCLAAIFLRDGEALEGLLLLFWLVVSVVATDIGAYVAGRTIGGPRLAPRISPNKTWAGLIGGMVSSAVAGGVFGVSVQGADWTTLSAVGAVIAVVAQAGDLLESMFKRRFAVKDSGTLIPGHGGVLDRLDGHITVISVMAAIVMVSGQTPLLW